MPDPDPIPADILVGQRREPERPGEPERLGELSPDLRDALGRMSRELEAAVKLSSGRLARAFGSGGAAAAPPYLSVRPPRPVRQPGAAAPGAFPPERGFLAAAEPGGSRSAGADTPAVKRSDAQVAAALARAVARGRRGL